MARKFSPMPAAPGPPLDGLSRTPATEPRRADPRPHGSGELQGPLAVDLFNERASTSRDSTRAVPAGPPTSAIVFLQQLRPAALASALAKPALTVLDFIRPGHYRPPSATTFR